MHNFNSRVTSVKPELVYVLLLTCSSLRRHLYLDEVYWMIRLNLVPFALPISRTLRITLFFPLAVGQIFTKSFANFDYSCSSFNIEKKNSFLVELYAKFEFFMRIYQVQTK